MSLTWTHGSSLVDWVDQVENELPTLGHRIAQDGLDALQHNIEINTPVETRTLRNSYQQSDIDYEAVMANGGYLAYAWTGRVFTEVEYALFVERGTGLWGPKRAKYKIEPKQPGGVLAFRPYMRGANGAVILDVAGGVTKGGLIVARFVLHPGSPGHAMFRIGAVLTEHQIHEWSQNGLRQFQRAASVSVVTPYRPNLVDLRR